jgi:hypothetical protein
MRPHPLAPLGTSPASGGRTISGLEHIRKTPPGRALEGFFMLRCPQTSDANTLLRVHVLPLAAICDGRRDAAAVGP